MHGAPGGAFGGDVLLQELRIDMSFPADEATKRFLDAAAEIGIEGAVEVHQNAWSNI